MSSLTVGQLRELLNGVPDDVEVYVAPGPVDTNLRNVYRAGAGRKVSSYGPFYEEIVAPGKPNFVHGQPCFIIRLTP